MAREQIVVVLLRERRTSLQLNIKKYKRVKNALKNKRYINLVSEVISDEILKSILMVIFIR